MVRHLARIRVDRAKELLAHSPLSLREIAARCGFASEQYLCAVFARLEGMPPGAFRAARGGR
jgi:transcriptional regulator GlxA family with amidase domain